SSVAPRGSSTTETATSFEAGEVLPVQSAQRLRSSAGSQLKRQPSTTEIRGRRSASARTAVDFPVPPCPMIKTPPINGSTTLRINASFISSWPTMAVNGNAFPINSPTEYTDFDNFDNDAPIH